ncbi:MAG: small multi-drug export protein [Candidatus Nezhaarchaeales archaeon]
MVGVEDQLQVLILIFVLSMLPLSELRGAIPVGLAAGVNPILVYVTAITGNILPVPLILFTLKSVEDSLCLMARRKASFNASSAGLALRIVNAYSTYLERTRRRVIPYVNRYGPLGLALFTAIPLPLTGAWTASLAAYLLGMDKWTALISIALGVLAAGVIVMGGFTALLTL